MDRGAWWATVHWVAKSCTDWRDLACTHIHTNAHTITSFEYTSSASPCHLYFRVKFLKDVSILTVSKPSLVFSQPTLIRLFVLPTPSHLLSSGEAAESTRTHQSSTLRLTWSLCSIWTIWSFLLPWSFFSSPVFQDMDSLFSSYFDTGSFNSPANAFSSFTDLMKLGHHQSSVTAPFLFSMQIHFLGDFI